MKSISTAAALAAISFCTAAMAAPVISGSYIVTERRMCQANAAFNFAQGETDNYVDQVSLQGGESGHTLLQAAFSPAKGKVTVSGFDATGDSMLFHLTGKASGTLGNPLTQKTMSGSKIAYSNTDTTLTINGTTYQVLYGQVDKNNIAHYAAFQGVNQNDIGEACSVQGEATRQ